MKKTISLICLLFIGVCNAQDVNVEGYELTLKDHVSTITISVNKKIKEERKLILKTQNRFCNNKKGVNITFTGGEQLKITDQLIVCENVGGNFIISTEIPLTDDLYNKIAKLDIIEFSLGNTKTPVIYDGGESLKNLIPYIDKN